VKACLSIVALAVALVGCGGGGSSDPAATPANPAADLMVDQRALYEDILRAPAADQPGLIATYNTQAAELLAFGPARACGGIVETEQQRFQLCMRTFAVMSVPWGTAPG